MLLPRRVTKVHKGKQFLTVKNYRQFLTARNLPCARTGARAGAGVEEGEGRGDCGFWISDCRFWIGDWRMSND
jgi:hypothetical protein